MKALKLGSAGPYMDLNHSFKERPNEARIRMVLGGVCATDLELIRGYMGFHGVLGHEWVGVVESTKSPELNGRRVVGEINCPCGICSYCLKGMGNHCRIAPCSESWAVTERSQIIFRFQRTICISFQMV